MSPSLCTLCPRSTTFPWRGQRLVYTRESHHLYLPSSVWSFSGKRMKITYQGIWSKGKERKYFQKKKKQKTPKFYILWKHLIHKKEIKCRKIMIFPHPPPGGPAVFPFLCTTKMLSVLPPHDSACFCLYLTYRYLTIS